MPGFDPFLGAKIIGTTSTLASAIRSCRFCKTRIISFKEEYANFHGVVASRRKLNPLVCINVNGVRVEGVEGT